MPAASLSDPQVVICLENAQVAAHVETMLSQRGLTVIGISPCAARTVPDLSRCRVVVTHTAMIGHIRALLDLPIVNFETFIFETHDDASPAPRRQFDAVRFIKRVSDVINTPHRTLACSLF